MAVVLLPNAGVASLTALTETDVAFIMPANSNIPGDSSQMSDFKSPSASVASRLRRQASREHEGACRVRERGTSIHGVDLD